MSEQKKWIEQETYDLIRSLMPIPCVDLVVHDRKGVLLCWRKIEPNKAKWTLPGGRILKGETLEEAVHRKAKQELGIKVKVERQIGAYSVDCQIHHAIIAAFLVSRTNNAPITLDSQHKGFKWISSPEDIEVPYIRQVIEDSGVMK